MDCLKCKVKYAYQAQRDYVELCPLHAAAGDLLDAAKIIQNKFFVKKQHISAAEMVYLVEAIAKAEGR